MDAAEAPAARAGPRGGAQAGRWVGRAGALGALLCLAAADGSRPLRLAVADGSHPFRLSVADAGMTGGVLHARIRFFWDDLQLAVAQHASDEDFELAETEKVDATIERYINEMLVLAVGDGDEVVRGRVTARGIDEAAVIDEVMWWYRMEYVVDESVERVHIRNRLLFNVFEDQRNIVHLKTRRGRERAYYFNLGDDSVTMRLN